MKNAKNPPKSLVIYKVWFGVIIIFTWEFSKKMIKYFFSKMLVYLKKKIIIFKINKVCLDMFTTGDSFADKIQD